MSFGQTEIRPVDDGMDISPAPPPDDDMEMDLLEESDTQMQILFDVDTNLHSDTSMMSGLSNANDAADADIELQDADATPTAGDAPPSLPFFTSHSAIPVPFQPVSTALHNSFSAFAPSSTLPTPLEVPTNTTSFQHPPPVRQNSGYFGQLETNVSINVEPPSATSTSAPVGNDIRPRETETVAAVDSTPTVVAVSFDFPPPAAEKNKDDEFEITYDDDVPQDTTGGNATEGKEVSAQTANDKEANKVDTNEAEKGSTEVGPGGEKTTEEGIQPGGEVDEHEGDTKPADPEGPATSAAPPAENPPPTLSDAPPSHAVVDASFQDSAHNTAADAEISASLHPIMVVYEEVEISLFPPRDGDDSETFFLEDENLLRASFGDLFKGFRGVLSEAISDSDELELFVDKLDLSFGEDHPECSTLSLSDVLNIFIKLHENDSAEVPALFIYLTTKPRFSHRLSLLRDHISKGDGISSIQATNGLDDLESFDEDDGESSDQLAGQEEQGPEADGQQDQDQPQVVVDDHHEVSLAQQLDESVPSPRPDDQPDEPELDHHETGEHDDAASLGEDFEQGLSEILETAEPAEEGQDEETAPVEEAEETAPLLEEHAERDQYEEAEGQNFDLDEGQNQAATGDAQAETDDQENGTSKIAVVYESDRSAGEDDQDGFDPGQENEQEGFDHEQETAALEVLASDSKDDHGEAPEGNSNTDHPEPVEEAGSEAVSHAPDDDEIDHESPAPQSPVEGDVAKPESPTLSGSAAHEGHVLGDGEIEFGDDENEEDYGDDEGNGFDVEEEEGEYNYEEEHSHDVHTNNSDPESPEDAGSATAVGSEDGSDETEAEPNPAGGSNEAHTDPVAAADDASVLDAETTESLDTPDNGPQAAASDGDAGSASDDDEANPDEEVLELDLYEVGDIPARESPTGKRTWTEHVADEDESEDESVKRVRPN